MLNRDYRDLLAGFAKHRVDYLLIGAYAMAVYGQPRATMDIDLWVRADANNASRVCAALRDFGAPADLCHEETLLKPGVMLQIGVAPRRIDLLTRIDALEFAPALQRALIVEVDGLRIPVLALADLITNKRATGRPQDRIDADRLSLLTPQDPLI